MTTFLFWNLNRRPLLPLVTTLVREQRVDVLVLAECAIPGEELLAALNANGQAPFSRPPDRPSHLTIFVRFPSESLISIADDGGIAINRFQPPGGIDILLIAVHLPSKLHISEREQADLSIRLAREIDKFEQQAGHTRTIVLGDLNMNPFEAGMVSAEGLHAVMSRSVAARTQRTVRGVRRLFFYNPMWSFFGDASPGPPGTYFHDRSRLIEYYWHIFDQVLIRPSLLPRFDDQHMEIITTIGAIQLLSPSKIPVRETGSDHLPVRFRIDLDQETSQ